MKKKILLLLIVLLSFGSRAIADDVRFIIPATSVEAAAKTLLDARAAAFYSVSSGSGVSNFNVKLIYSGQYPLSFEFLPNSRFRLTCGFTARANINYVAGNFDINGSGPITIEGDLLYEGGAAQITLIGRATIVVDIQGAPGFLLSLIGAGEFTVRLPEFRLGSYALILPNISSTYFVSTTPSLAIIGDNLQLGLQSDTPVVVNLDQKRESGQRLEGTQIGVWGDNSFNDYTIPFIANFPRGSTQTLRGLQDTVQNPTEKYNRWNDLSQVQNHQSFLMDGSFTELTSNFRTTYDGVVIRNELLSAPQQDAGNVEFKDPWLIDYNDPPYGIRNQGMAAPFKTYPSPLNITLASEFKGVFLNQDYGDPGVPYYSVRAPQTQVIPFHGQDITWYFQGWKGAANEVTYQYPDRPETAVVFKQEGAVARAMYKGHLVSSHSTATETHSGRRMVRDASGYYHLVYEDGGNIWYVQSSDITGQQWTAQEERVNEFLSDGFTVHRYPSIDYINQTICICWVSLSLEDGQVFCYSVFTRQKNLATGQWMSEEEVYASPWWFPAIIAQPVLASYVDGSGKFNFLLSCDEGSGDTPRIRTYYNEAQTTD